MTSVRRRDEHELAFRTPFFTILSENNPVERQATQSFLRRPFRAYNLWHPNPGLTPWAVLLRAFSAWLEANAFQGGALHGRESPEA
jgi:hypothetical protein